MAMGLDFTDPKNISMDAAMKLLQGAGPSATPQAINPMMLLALMRMPKTQVGTLPGYLMGKGSVLPQTPLGQEIGSTFGQSQFGSVNPLGLLGGSQ